MTDMFANPSIEQMERSCSEGSDAFRTGRANPYRVGEYDVAPLLAWAFEFGVRIEQHMQARRRECMRWLLEQQRSAA